MVLPPGAGMQFKTFRQHSGNNCRRRHGDRQTDDQSDLPLLAVTPNRCNHGSDCRNCDLSTAKSEYSGLHGS